MTCILESGSLINVTPIPTTLGLCGAYPGISKFFALLLVTKLICKSNYIEVYIEQWVSGGYLYTYLPHSQ